MGKNSSRKYLSRRIQEIVTKGKYIGISFEQLCDLIKQVWEEK